MSFVRFFWKIVDNINCFLDLLTFNVKWKSLDKYMQIKVTCDLEVSMVDVEPNDRIKLDHFWSFRANICKPMLFSSAKFESLDRKR